MTPKSHKSGMITPLTSHCSPQQLVVKKKGTLSPIPPFLSLKQCHNQILNRTQLNYFLQPQILQDSDSLPAPLIGGSGPSQGWQERNTSSLRWVPTLLIPRHFQHHVHKMWPQNRSFPITWARNPRPFPDADLLSHNFYTTATPIIT